MRKNKKKGKCKVSRQQKTDAASAQQADAMMR
jgi:hypothetical protein